MIKRDDLPPNFLNILTQAMENKMYGSIEVYFEEGRVTQITQRIINKVQRSNLPVALKSKRSF